MVNSGCISHEDDRVYHTVRYFKTRHDNVNVGTRRVPWVNASLWSHSRSVFLTRKLYDLIAVARLCREHRLQAGIDPKISAKKVFSGQSSDFKAMFSTCFAAFHFCKNRSSKEFGDSRSRQGHTPQPFTLAYALPHRSEKCLHICRALRPLGQRNPKDMNSRVFVLL